MSDSLDENELVAPASPPFPKTVLIAGIIWIVCGAMLFLIAALCFAVPEPGRYYMCWGLVLGAGSIYLGAQTVRGTTCAVLEFGVASILFCILSLPLSILGPLSVAGGFDVDQRANSLLAMLVWGANVFISFALLAAGVLALLGNCKYRTWRDFQAPGGGGGI